MNGNDIIKITPTILDDSLESRILGYHYLPYSTGFEIECNMKPGYRTDVFTSIPNIMEADVNEYEQRFRIPEGLEGLKCLFEISSNLKEQALFNPDSGIHYHIDCTDVYKYFNKEFVAKHKEWILNELDSWNYQGTYNKRNIEFSLSHNWVRFQETFKTMEFRLGEMTFDYELLFKRITHANAIVRRLKEELIETVEDDDQFSDYDFNEKDVLNTRIIKI